MPVCVRVPVCMCVSCVRVRIQAGEGGNFLDDASINDYYRVQFTRDADRGRPVGGAFRYSALGRAFFKTEEAYQHVLGMQAVNMLFFTFAGFCPGCIVLRGELQRCGEDERTAVAAKFQTPPPGLSPQTIKVLFEPPRIFFGRSGVLNFEIGPVTTVYLDTTYLDERVRIGRNRFGGHFVFTRLQRGEKAVGAKAAAWQPLLQRPKVPVSLVAIYALAGIGALVNPALLPAAALDSTKLPRRAVAAALILSVPLLLLLLFSAT